MDISELKSRINNLDKKFRVNSTNNNNSYELSDESSDYTSSYTPSQLLQKEYMNSIEN